MNEIQNYKGPNSGGVSAFSIDRSTGKLTFLNEVPSRGADPCYITLDKTGKYVLVANYTGGSIAAFPVLEDGRLGEASAFVQHTGHGTNPERQEKAHAHSIDLSPDNRFAMVDDLVSTSCSSTNSTAQTDRSRPTIRPSRSSIPEPVRATSPSARTESSPTSSLKCIYRTVFSNDQKTGTLHPLQTISALPKDFAGENDDAEIEMHPSGKFLYASNRGSDTHYRICNRSAKGTLTPVAYTPTQGKMPRSFEIDPTGKFLFAANQKSDNIVVFRIDPKTGRLTPTGQALDVGSPVCVKFLKVQ